MEGTEPMDPCHSEPLPPLSKANAPGIAHAWALWASQRPCGGQAADKAHQPGLWCWLLQRYSSQYLGKSC